MRHGIKRDRENETETERDRETQRDTHRQRETQRETDREKTQINDEGCDTGSRFSAS